MRKSRSPIWEKAILARDQLIKEFLGNPEVILIDIGYQPRQSNQPGEIVLRIHVRPGWLEEPEHQTIAFPKEVQGFPVVVIPGDYRLEPGQ